MFNTDTVLTETNTVNTASTSSTDALTLSMTSLAAAISERVKHPGRRSFQAELADLSEAVGLQLEDVVSRVGTPLWQVLGWQQADLTGLLPDWGELRGEAGGEAEYNQRFQDAVAAYPGIIGKNDNGIYPTEDSITLDLGDDHWRTVDFVRAPTLRPSNPYLLTITSDIQLVKGDTELGDGIYARVRPETINFERAMQPGEATYLQNRAFVYTDARTGIKKVFKGLIHISPDNTTEFFAPQAGYGTKHVAGYGDTLEIHPMLDVADYKPEGRVSDQLGSYAGVDGWYEHYQPSTTLQMSELFDGSRMMLAGAQLRWLPVGDAMRVAQQAMKACVTINMGVRRKAAPGLDLQPFTFRAPEEMRSTFQIGTRWVIHRDPALPDGTSSWSGVCVGYSAGNFFELPTNASPHCKVDGKKVSQGVWEQGGGDFDGDDALVLPHRDHGGIILGFNDRSPEEQAGLLAAAGEAGRKMAGFKKQNYASGTIRWREQRRAALELGMLDYLARKLLDSTSQGKFLAAGVKPWIQCAVDRQKRNLPYPGDFASLPKMKGTFATQVLSFIKKPSADIQVDKTDWRHTWDMLEASAAHIETLIGGEDSGLTIQPGKHAALRPVCEWALGIWKVIRAELGESRFQQGYPRANLFPGAQLQVWRAERAHEITSFGGALSTEPGLEQVQSMILKARKFSPALGRAAEALLAKHIKAQDAGEAHELALQLTDPQTWIKCAPLQDLQAFFQHPMLSGYGNVRAEDLGGVIVLGRGGTFKQYGKFARNTRKLIVGGQVYGEGELLVEEIVISSTTTHTPVPGNMLRRTLRRTELRLSGHGSPLAQVVGSFEDFARGYTHLKAAVKSSLAPHTLRRLADLVQPEYQLLSEAELSTLSTYAQMLSENQLEKVWRELGDELLALGFECPEGVTPF